MAEGEDVQESQEGTELSEDQKRTEETTDPTAQAEQSEPTEEPDVTAEPVAETAPEGEASAEEEAAPEDVAPEEAAPEDVAPEEIAPEEEPAPRQLVELASEARYFATGKRKSSVARVIVRPGNGAFDLNGRSLEVYFPRARHQAVVRQPLDATGYLERVDVRARIHGGGISGQAGAVRHGIAKALIEVDPNLRGELKRRQFLTRDPREKERRKAGLKKARKRPQFSKR
jgi:small subunit ribosomal protein S9